jgi:hypothetical protein
MRKERKEKKRKGRKEKRVRTLFSSYNPISAFFYDGS